MSHPKVSWQLIGLFMKEHVSKREKRTQRNYRTVFKLWVVSQVENGDYTYKQAQKEYGIQGRSIVLVWLWRYANLELSKPKLHTLSNSKENPAQKIRRLEKELADEKLKTKVLNTTIVKRDYHNRQSFL